MKKLFFTAALSLLVMGAFAQKKVLKGADKAFKKGSLEEAATLAKQASENDETKNNPDVYILLGKISLQQFVDGSFADIEQARKSLEWFNKALELSDDKGKEKINEDPIVIPTDEGSSVIGGGEALGLLEHYLVTEGDKALQNEEYTKAYPMIDLTYQIEGSVERAFFAGYAAEQAENMEIAAKYYETVISYDEAYDNKSYAYNRTIQYNLDNQNFDKGLELIRRAKDVYPEEKLYKKWEVDALIQADKMSEAITSLKQVVADGNADKETYYTLGFLLWNNEELDEAEKMGKKALELDPDYNDAYYVVASVVFNQGAEIMKQANMEVDDDTKYEQLKKGAHDKFREAMPMFERLAEADPKDLYALRPLSTIYDQLDMDEKRDAILDQIDKIESGGE